MRTSTPSRGTSAARNLDVPGAAKKAVSRAKSDRVRGAARVRAAAVRRTVFVHAAALAEARTADVVDALGRAALVRVSAGGSGALAADTVGAHAERALRVRRARGTLALAATTVFARVGPAIRGRGARFAVGLAADVVDAGARRAIGVRRAGAAAAARGAAAFQALVRRTLRVTGAGVTGGEAATVVQAVSVAAVCG